MSARGAISLQGEVLEVEHKSGTGDYGPYNYYLASVLVGTKVVAVKYAADNADVRPPAEGEHVHVLVDLGRNPRVTAKRNAVAAATHAKAS